jgi:membrane protease YdiL (CAAX protease family)
MFRGYPLSKLSLTMGRNWANFIIALFFMAGHWGGEGWSVMTIINILLFSLLCGAFRFTEGGLPVVCGFHFSWNSLQFLLGATLTGENFKVPFIQFESSGADWLSGGI